MSDVRTRATRPRLLVSVRDVAEAVLALEGGASVIDVKEPSRGSLGRADDAVIAGVVAAVRAQSAGASVSAALGELHEQSEHLSLPPDVTFAKVGLAGADRDWPVRLVSYFDTFGEVRPIVAAYADAPRAASPPVESVVDWACDRGVGVLIDTYIKDGRSLFDWLGPGKIAALIERLHQARCVIALAGSLDVQAIETAASLGPDWVAVRGAACGMGDRNGPIDANRVANLARTLRATPVATV